MYISRRKLEALGIEVRLDDEALMILGSDRIPNQTIKKIHAVAADLDLTARDTDDLVDHVVNITVWTALRRAAE